MPRKSKKKPAQEPVPEHKTEQPPASSPAAEPIMKPAQPALSETKPTAETPAETNPVAAPAETKTAEAPAQTEAHSSLEPEGTAMEIPLTQVSGRANGETASTTIIEPKTTPIISTGNGNDGKDTIMEETRKAAAPIGIGALKSLEIDSILIEANKLAITTGRQPIFGTAFKRTSPLEADPSAMAPELRDAVVKLRHARPDIRLDGISRIGSMKDAAAAVPSLIRLLNDPDDYIRSNAAWAIGRIGKDVKAAVPFLIDALNDGCCDVRQFAATALGEIGDSSAIESLEVLARIDRDWMLKRAIGAALKKLKA